MEHVVDAGNAKNARVETAVVIARMGDSSARQVMLDRNQTNMLMVLLQHVIFQDAPWTISDEPLSGMVIE